MSAPPSRTSLTVRIQVLEQINNANIVREICKLLGAREGEADMVRHAIAETLLHTRWLWENEARIKAALAREGAS